MMPDSTDTTHHASALADLLAEVEQLLNAAWPTHCTALNGRCTNSNCTENGIHTANLGAPITIRSSMTRQIAGLELSVQAVAYGRESGYPGATECWVGFGCETVDCADADEVRRIARQLRQFAAVLDQAADEVEQLEAGGAVVQLGRHHQGGAQ